LPLALAWLVSRVSIGQFELDLREEMHHLLGRDSPLRQP